MNKSKYQRALLLRIIGFTASLVLTLAAYLIIVHPDLFHLGVKPALVIIILFAAIQFAVQFIFFINLWHEKGSFWNVGIFISTLSLLLLIIIFSIWIMDHLNYNMM